MSVNQLRSLRKCVPTLLLAAALSPAAYAKDQVPDWVREAAAIKTPTYSAKTDAVVLLHDVSYTVGTDGTLTEHVRRVVRVLRPQGRRYAEMFASFDKASKLRYVHIWSIGPDGKEYAVKDSDQKEYSTSRFELYSDGRVRGLQAPASDVGAVAAMEFERQDKPYENDIVWIPGERLPVVKERMTLNLPTGYSFTSSWKGKQTTQPVDAEHGRTFWEALNQEPLFSEDELPLAPHEIALVPRLDVFYQGPGVAGQYGAMNGSWRGVGEWYERLGKDRNKPDATITAKAQELVQGKTEFRDRVNAIAGFVQRDIRYVAIEIGVGGEQPHAAADTFHARYGDCKDKATLLSAMLNAVGLRSTWVMVDTRRGMVSEEAPSIVGNHMIAAIELPADYKPKDMYSIVTTTQGKRYLIFDPTWEKLPFGQLEHELQGGTALLVDGSDSQAIRLPVLRPEQNLIERKSRFQLALDGSLSGTVNEQETGEIATRQRYLSMEEEKDQRKALEQRVGHDLNAFQIADEKTMHANNLQDPMTLSYSLKAQGFAQDAGSLMMVRPRVLGEDSFWVDTKKRAVPIDLGSTREVRDDIEIALPDGVSVEELPSPVNLDVGFASYHSESKTEGRTIHYRRTYIVREIMLPPDRYADVQKLARFIHTDEQTSAVLKRN